MVELFWIKSVAWSAWSVACWRYKPFIIRFCVLNILWWNHILFESKHICLTVSCLCLVSSKNLFLFVLCFCYLSYNPCEQILRWLFWNNWLFPCYLENIKTLFWLVFIASFVYSISIQCKTCLIVLTVIYFGYLQAKYSGAILRFYSCFILSFLYFVFRSIYFCVCYFIKNYQLIFILSTCSLRSDLGMTAISIAKSAILSKLLGNGPYCPSM